MAVVLTIDGHPIELAGDKSATEVTELFRWRLLEGQDLDKLIVLKTSSGNEVYVQAANVTWFAAADREMTAGFLAREQ